MFSTDFIFRQQENLVDNQKCQAGCRPLCNKILLPLQDLVKSHLMNAVRSEVEELKEKIIKLEETINQQQVELTTSSSNFTRELGKLQAENQFLRNHVGSDVINQLSNLEFYDPVNQATQLQQQNQVQNIQDSQSIQVSAFSLFVVNQNVSRFIRY